MRLIRIAASVLVAIVLIFSARARAENHDLLIRNGRIVDGTGNPWFYGDLAVRDGRISAIGDLRDHTADALLDARGMIVAPGFIDVHTHVENQIISSPHAENFVRNGVTTIITGNCGSSVTNVGEYFRRIEEKGAAINVATLIGQNSVLRNLKGDRAGELTDEQMTKAREMVRQAMQDGAVGMSTGLIYTPGKWSQTEEIIELQKVVAQFGGIYVSHMRDEGSGILRAIDEALRIGRETGSRVQISHFKLPADVAQRIGGAHVTLGRVAEARAAGQEVWIDQYPYTASSTSITVMLPDWLRQDGAEEARKILSDPDQVQRVIEDMRQNHEVRRGRTHLGYAVIARCRAFPEFDGRNLREVAQIFKLREQGDRDVELLAEDPQALPPVTMEDQYRAVIKIYLAGGASCVFHTMDETEVETIMQHPLVGVASDSGIRTFGSGQPHPRGYGTNSRVLGRYVRERGLITLEDAVRKMTSMPAMAFRLHDRGVLRVNFVADIVVFDPDTVIDRATFEQPHQYPEGIPYVIVNGRVVLAGGHLTGELPGRPVRFTGP